MQVTKNLKSQLGKLSGINSHANALFYKCCVFYVEIFNLKKPAGAANFKWAGLAPSFILLLLF